MKDANAGIFDNLTYMAVPQNAVVGAYYVQAAYRLPAPAHLWKPYFRFEHIGIDANDAVFTTAPQVVPRLDGTTLGVRFDIALYAAVKGEYRTWTRGEGTVRNHGGFFQVCFTF